MKAKFFNNRIALATIFIVVVSTAEAGLVSAANVDIDVCKTAEIVKAGETTETIVDDVLSEADARMSCLGQWQDKSPIESESSLKAKKAGRF